MAAKTDVLERLKSCHKEAQAAIRTALEVDELDGGAFSLASQNSAGGTAIMITRAL